MYSVFQMVYWYRSHARLGPRILSTITWSEKAQCTLSSWLTKMYSRKVFSHPLLSSGHFHSHLSLLCSLLQLPSIRLQLLNLRTPSLVSGVTISWDHTRLTLKTSPDEVAHLAKTLLACWVVAGPNQTTSASKSNFGNCLRNWKVFR